MPVEGAGRDPGLGAEVPKICAFKAVFQEQLVPISQRHRPREAIAPSSLHRLCINALNPIADRVENDFPVAHIAMVLEQKQEVEKRHVLPVMAKVSSPIQPKVFSA